MNPDKELSIVIPCLNEQDTIESLLKNLQNLLSEKYDHEIIVVDDGSSDNTSTIARGIAGITVIRHPYNKGNGASVKAGIQKAKGGNAVIIDADGQHDPKHILEMLKLLDEYDLVVGARESFGVGRRGFGNMLVSKIASYLSGIAIPDLTSGFRAFKKEKMLEFLHILPNRFSLPSTSTLAFAVNGYNIKFIPIRANKRQGGISSIKVLRDGIKFIILIFRIISLFNPLKVFAPTSIILLIMGFFWSIKVYLMDTGGVSSVGTMLILAGIITFLFGLLTDQISATRLTMGKIMKSKLIEDDNNPL
jgi:glycosyltransferase involved in cell wall biosynthesis